MPDLLTHVLVGYVLGTVLRWYTEPVRRHHVSLLMIGAVLPDLSKAFLLVSHETVATLLGAPFSWLGVHTLGSVLVLAAAGAFLLGSGHRRLGFGLFAAGGCTHLFLDMGVRRASGLAPPYLYPFTWWQPPSADLYLSSDLWPFAVVTAVALLVWLRDRRIALDG